MDLEKLSGFLTTLDTFNQKLDLLDRHDQFVTTVTLNVGGTIFETTRATLSGKEISDKESVLAKLNDQKSFFFDRDPTHFRYILNYLRLGEEVVLPSSPSACREIMMETKFFKLPFLFRLLERHLERLKQDENCVPAGQIQGNSEILLTRDHAEVVDENQKFPNLVAKKCYMCKLVVMEEMTEVGTVLCRACCHLNSVKRNQWVDLSSKVAMVTGGRVKIGFQTALKLLRCRAIVIVTTRKRS
eukprot:TRINITY_DN3580_c0_g1_i5.p1 TRINITY_DN3580_c0_g1~~TRINITY_DN3580_c0_g1_i5.p1  ORF type:complete len:243 (+),score=49.46 TRINITY_DN3580_c0_g1_i5:756-1484(+)